jgi:hypothetical protein
MFGSSGAQRNQGFSNQAFGKTEGSASRSNMAPCILTSTTYACFCWLLKKAA